MKKGIKICTIGGGSSYTPELIEGFIKRYDELPVKEIWLVDCEEGKEKLKIVGELAKRMVKKSELPIKINTTLNRKEALKDADFVTTQIRVGLLEARIKDELISFKHGVMGQETNGPGGLFKGLRTIPVILDICKDIENLCPEAWLINFTNPAGMVTEAVLRYSNIKKVIGVCNVPIGMERHAAKLLEVDSSRVRMVFGGLNHMVYGLNVYLDGKEVTDIVIDKMGKAKNQHSMKNIDPVKWDANILNALGVIPCSYHRYFYMYKELLEKDLNKAKTRGEIVKKIEKELFELYKDPGLNEKPKVLEERGGSYYSDVACNLIASIYNDKRDIQTVNTQNKGAIRGIPYESAVEVSSVITKEGPIPLTIGELPVQVNGLVQQIKSFERLACEAAITGDKNKAVLAMVTHPFVQSQDNAKVIFEDMLEAHKEYLPQFFN